jgi:hypothetical protein
MNLRFADRVPHSPVLFEKRLVAFGTFRNHVQVRDSTRSYVRSDSQEVEADRKLDKRHMVEDAMTAAQQTRFSLCELTHFTTTLAACDLPAAVFLASEQLLLRIVNNDGVITSRARLEAFDVGKRNLCCLLQAMVETE